MSLRPNGPAPKSPISARRSVDLTAWPAATQCATHHPRPTARFRGDLTAVAWPRRDSGEHENRPDAGSRELEQFTATDIWPLEVIRHALQLMPNDKKLTREPPDALVHTPDPIAAVAVVRTPKKPSLPALGSPAGLADDDTVARRGTRR
jgi:hypothetical protein